MSKQTRSFSLFRSRAGGRKADERKLDRSAPINMNETVIHQARNEWRAGMTAKACCRNGRSVGDPGRYQYGRSP